MTTTKLRHSAGTPASIGGQFKAHTHSDSDVTLEAVSSSRIDAARAIADALASGDHLYPEFHPDGRVLLREQSGGIHYVLHLDEEGLPTEVSSGLRLPYASEAFHAAEEAAYRALGRPVPPMHERNNRHIAFEIRKAGSLFYDINNPNGAPGDPAMRTEDVRVGTGPDGERIYVSLRMEFSSKPHTDTDLNAVSGTWTFAMQGTTKSKTGRELSGGQNMDDVRTAAGRGGADTAGLATLWERNHLNTFTAGTAQQELTVSKLRAKDPRITFGELSREVADDRGYKYGHSWLYKPVPADDVASVIRILREAQAA